MKTTCTAFIFHKDKLLLVFHKKNNGYMHVGGHMEEDETFSECLFREIKEETNLDVSIVDFSEIPILLDSPLKREPVPFFIHSGVRKDARRKMMLDYICICGDASSLRLQESELSDYKWVTQSELDAIDMPSILRTLAKEAFREYNKQFK